MSSFRTAAFPIPAQELQQIRDYLAPHYGAQVWEGSGHRVLIVRVPHDEPDPVNDLETAVEYVQPGDARDLTHLLLAGDRRIEAVYPGPLAALMEERVRFDASECGRLRGELGPHGHRLYTASGDARRLVRLALRLPKESVKDLDDEDLDAFADGIGSELEGSRVRAARAVYLIAHEDHARLDADLFVPDLRERWQDQDRRRRILLDAERRHREEHERKERQRRDLLREMEKRFRPRVARAPLRRHDPPQWERLQDRVDAVTQRAPEQPATAAHDAAGPPMPDLPPDVSRGVPPGTAPPMPATASARLPAGTPGAVPGPSAAAVAGPEAAPGAAPEAPGAAPAGSGAVLEPPAPTPGIPAQAKARLESCGYDVLLDPDVPGHRIDLAAERAEGYPARVLAWFPPRLTVAVADAMLDAARQLQCDLALAVSEAADPEAERRLVATKGKWVRPQELSALGL